MNGANLHHLESDPELDSDHEDDFKLGNSKPCPVILHMDSDCYEAQLLMLLYYRHLIGKNIPCVAINHDDMVLAVNYAAKRLGIKRIMPDGRNALKAAKSICEEAGLPLEILKTAERFGKSDSFTQQIESDKILQVILDYRAQQGGDSIVINRASKDEFYIDVTKLVDRRTGQKPGMSLNPNPSSFQREFNQLTSTKKGKTDETYQNTNMVVLEGKNSKISGDTLNYRILQVYGAPPSSPVHRNHHQAEYRLVHGAFIAMEIAQKIQESLQYIVSSGVGHSQLLAKIACGRNKPEGITIMTDMGFERLSRKALKITDLPGFGGGEGQNLEQALKTECKAFSLIRVLKVKRSILESLCQEIVPKLGDGESVANNLRKKCRGIDDSAVEEQLFKDSLNTSTTFKAYGNRLCNKKRIRELCADVADRLNYFWKKWSRRTDFVSVKIKTKTKRDDESQTKVAAEANQINIGHLDPVRDLALVEQCLEDLVWGYINILGIKEKELDQIQNIQLTASPMRDLKVNY